MPESNGEFSPPAETSLDLHQLAPRWTRAKFLAGAAAAVALTLCVLARLLVAGSGSTGLPAGVPGFAWSEAEAHWQWPELIRGQDWRLRGDALLDMLASGGLAVILVLLWGQAGMREISRRRYLRRGALCAVLAAVLAYTYHWCGIDPLGVWTSRGNAWRHLAGRTFNAQDLAEIRADAERAPNYYAEGEANYVVAAKYKDLPPEKTPSLFTKQKEVQAVKADILAKLSPVERKNMVEQEYLRLVDKKRGGYWPPETALPRLKAYFTALLETIAIAIWASLLAVVCAIPCSVLAAGNTLALLAPGDSRPARVVRWVGVFVVRRFLDACRGFNELVMALIFVSVIGLGPFAGILALWIHTTGILGKVFSEAIEAIDPGQVEALVGTGASATQTISFAVLPQVMPIVISYSLLRFESNVRSAAILGWVGAGGIGFLLQDKMVGYCHREVCTMMIMIIAAVSLIDYGCGLLRRRFI